MESQQNSDLSDRSWLFIPSPSPTLSSLRPSLYDEISQRVSNAQAINNLNPSLELFIRKHKQPYLQVLGRHVELIKSRSQAFEDAHITVYDKILLTLTRNGNDLDNIAAMQYFSEEFLGMGAHRHSTGDARKLNESVLVASLGSNGLTDDLDCFSGTDMETVANAVHVRDRNDNYENMEPGLARLWSIYKKSEAEFASALSRNSDEAISAAKFLRDTAENTLQYIKHRNPDPEMVFELEATCNMAKAKAVALSGGRERKFDLTGADTSQKGSYSSTERTRKRSPRIAVALRARFRGKENNYRPRPTDKWTHPLASKPRGHERRRYDTQPGRGHSGIPYGYTRDVDQYRPAQR